MVKKTNALTKPPKALKDREIAHALRERIKELTCLYSISQISGKNAAAPDTIFHGIAEVIPPALQYAEAAAARIVLDGKSYHSSNFEDSRCKMVAPVIIAGKRRGMVEVVYTSRLPHRDGVRFLKEERTLLRAIARQVAFIVTTREADAERAELQRQLIHADRLATIGQLAAGVAHELNEPLGTILGFAQLACKHPGLQEKPRHDIEKIVDASLYAREIVKKLLIFARQTPVFKSRICFNDVVSEALGMFEHRFEKDAIALVCGLSPRLPPVVADGGQLKQVIVNLVVNSMQAMPEGGVLTVRTAFDGACLVCTVKDTGTGMTKETLNRIFVPFFTTKDVDRGTGLGLPVVHGIVTSHGGTIAVESTPGRGTIVTIRLPVDPINGRKKAGQ
jgi:two-component system, NtrC family, sensor kinase